MGTLKKTGIFGEKISVCGKFQTPQEELQNPSSYRQIEKYKTIDKTTNNFKTCMDTGKFDDSHKLLL